MERRHISVLGLAIFFMLVVSVLAYNNLIPKDIKAIPWYDSIGHFILFGTLGHIAHHAFKRKSVLVYGRMVPLGPILVIIYAFIDESLQVFSKNRTFDLGDLFFGVLGITIFVFFATVFRSLRSTDLKAFLIDLWYFFVKQLRSILFAGLFFLLLISSRQASELLGIYRYDWLFIGSMLIQFILVMTRLETKDEAKTIFLFHIVGIVLEIYKTSHFVGSWSYPEAGYLKLLGVPLYSGFMYAAVGSYIAHAWKIFHLRLTAHPSYRTSILLCAMIYLNFFTNHFIYDLRYFLMALVFGVYYRTNVFFTPRQKKYHMPLSLGFILIAAFIWIGENIATYFGAWKYPDQIHAWHVVSTQKVTSWFLLVIISFIIVANLKYFKQNPKIK